MKKFFGAFEFDVYIVRVSDWQPYIVAHYVYGKTYRDGVEMELNEERRGNKPQLSQLGEWLNDYNLGQDFGHFVQIKINES